MTNDGPCGNSNKTNKYNKWHIKTCVKNQYVSISTTQWPHKGQSRRAIVSVCE